ncbi:hypothetical protein [Vibrio splendidus]|uniref:Uncharacterized protein n=1 Tax=Vibrio splendidus 12E03 TaxID=1191305 RepID=A0A1E5FD76_VIBSP|nr:hypothetical protein [Vibrio splendidus]OEF86912.1 hypothetical protein A142_10085 [Vibrio splendidus 12E03]
MLKKCWAYISSGSVYRQEFFNFIISLILGPLILFGLLLFGVESDGTFKNTIVEFGINFFSSFNGLYFAFFYLIPMLAFLLIKARLLEAPNFKVFLLLIQLISGIFYSIGSAVVIVSSTVVKYGIDFSSETFFWGWGIILLGFGVFAMFLDFLPPTSPKAS